MALSVGIACAQTPVSVRPAAVEKASTVREDAGPSYYEEDEVDVTARPVDPIQPSYPPELRALGIEGEVEARVIVLADGRADGARLVKSSHHAFTAATREALRQARFHPARIDGRPVASWVTLRLRFRLED